MTAFLYSQCRGGRSFFLRLPGVAPSFQLMLPHPARLACQILSEAEEILAAQTPPSLVLGGIEPQQDVFIDDADAHFRRSQSGRVEAFGRRHRVNVPCLT